jgi:hypothetical protein
MARAYGAIDIEEGRSGILPLRSGRTLVRALNLVLSGARARTDGGLVDLHLGIVSTICKAVD